MVSLGLTPRPRPLGARAVAGPRAAQDRISLASLRKMNLMFSKIHHAIALASSALLLTVAAASCTAEVAPGNGSEQGSNAAEPVGEAQQASACPCVSSCNLCDNALLYEACVEGVCCGSSAHSNPDWAICNGACTDLNNDAANCGGCGVGCPGTWVRHTFLPGICISGTCVL